MKKIELTPEEIQVIHEQLNGEIEVWSATEFQQKHLMSVIDKAEALNEELDFEDIDGDLIQWFWDKYKVQEGIQ